MNLEQIIREGQETIYHEIGHVFGYCLSNTNQNTSLGLIKHVKIGIYEREVVPVNNLFHIGDPKIDLSTFKIDSKNLNQMIAWFIEVLLGCTFETIKKNIEFRECFFETTGNGIFDLRNINRIKQFSEFKWDDDLLTSLQVDLVELIKNYKIIESIKFIIEELIDEIINNEGQILISGSSLEKLVLKLNNLITPEIKDAYLDLVNKYNIQLKYRN